MTDFTQPWFKSFKAQTFDPHHHPHPTPKTRVSGFKGMEALKSKKSIGESVCWAK